MHSRRTSTTPTSWAPASASMSTARQWSTSGPASPTEPAVAPGTTRPSSWSSPPPRAQPRSASLASSQDGKLSYADKVADHWPEFAQNGKGEHHRQSDDEPSSRHPCRRRHAHLRRPHGGRPCGRGPRGTGPDVGAGQRTRLSRRHLRLARRRAAPAHRRAHHGYVLQRGDRRSARPRLLDRSARGRTSIVFRPSSPPRPQATPRPSNSCSRSPVLGPWASGPCSWTAC